MTTSIDPYIAGSIGIIVGVAIIVIPAAVKNWLQRRCEGPRMMGVRYVPRDPEDQVMEYALDLQPSTEAQERRALGKHLASKGLGGR